MWRQSNKYKATKVQTEDGTFDSKKEYKRWCELKLLQSAGVITELQRQVSFELIPSQRINGKVAERAVRYIADFTYKENGRVTVEDTKGMKTKEYIIKRKLMLFLKDIEIKEV